MILTVVNDLRAPFCNIVDLYTHVWVALKHISQSDIKGVLIIKISYLASERSFHVPLFG
jgi:hypothetical protein